jgi:type I restriction enzyme M protein
LFFEQTHPQEKTKAPQTYGQELNPVTFAIAKMNTFLHDYTDAHFAIGDTFRNPGFAVEGVGLKKFDYVVANPMWNQDNYDEGFYDGDKWGRFEYGIPPRSSADWGWVQHMFASLNDNGRAAVVLDTGAVSRGSGSRSSNREKEIRKNFVENDFIEGVILLPDNLFYNTTAPGIILILNRNKPTNRENEFLLVNASAYFVKHKPKNVLSQNGITAIADVFRQWETKEKLSRVLRREEALAADYNLSPCQFVEVEERVTHRPLSDILEDLAVARVERERADVELERTLNLLGAK